MKRFFCTTCTRIKRVRVLPSDVKLQIDASGSGLVPIGVLQNRTGTCRWHDHIGERRGIMGRARVLSHLGNTSKMSASSAKAKSKK
jgi:hypothetical protein